MESLAPSGEYLKKHKLAESTHHLLISRSQKHYLLLLHPNSTLTLLQCSHEQIDTVGSIPVPTKDPVALTTGHQQTVCLLTVTALLLWDFSQLQQKYPPIRIELTPTSSPSAVFHIQSNHYLLVSPANRILQLYQSHSLEQELSWPAEMDIGGAIMHPDRSSEGPILLVPSTSGRLPYLLDQSDLSRMT